MHRFIILLALAASTHAAVTADQAAAIRQLLADRKIAAAESAANALASANPKDAEACALLGRVRLAKGDGNGAMQALAKATELAPASGEYQRLLGDACGLATQHAGMFSMMSLAKRCRSAYEKAVELAPADIEARNSLMMFYQQAPAMLGGGLEKAHAQADAIRKLDAARGRVAFAILYAGEKKYAEAFAELDEVLRAASGNYAALYQLGRVAALSGTRIDDGMAALERCLSIEPPAGTPGHDAANWRLGNLWEKKGDKAAARSAYKAALAVNPRFAQAITSLKQLD